MSKELYKQLLKAPHLPVSMETVFGSTKKERHLSLYNDYVFYRSTWSFFRCFDIGSTLPAPEVPVEFSIKNFTTKYLSAIDPQVDDSVSFGVPVFCATSAVTLPISVGSEFALEDAVIAVRNAQREADIAMDRDEDTEDVNEPDQATW
jgi:hypothetical protein